MDICNEKNKGEKEEEEEEEKEEEEEGKGKEGEKKISGTNGKDITQISKSCIYGLQ